jgi:hypothetical protein
LIKAEAGVPTGSRSQLSIAATTSAERCAASLKRLRNRVNIKNM